ARALVDDDLRGLGPDAGDGFKLLGSGGVDVDGPRRRRSQGQQKAKNGARRFAAIDPPRRSRLASRFLAPPAAPGQAGGTRMAKRHAAFSGSMLGLCMLGCCTLRRLARCGALLYLAGCCTLLCRAVLGGLMAIDKLVVGGLARGFS